MNGPVGCIALFLLPFAGVGVFAAVQTVRMVAMGDWKQAAFFAIFAITFGAVGIGGLIALARGRRRLADVEAARAGHPDEPWLWRADWAAGRIEDSNRTTARFAWGFVALWNLVSLPAAYFGVRAALEEGNRAGLVALVFPVAGLALLVWAARISARVQRFGVSRLELETRPAAIGRSLSGTVLAPLPLTPANGFRVVLSCIRRVTTGSGDDRSTSERVLWQEEQQVPGFPATTATPATRYSGDWRSRRMCPAWTTPRPSRSQCFGLPRATDRAPKRRQPPRGPSPSRSRTFSRARSAASR